VEKSRKVVEKIIDEVRIAFIFILFIFHLIIIIIIIIIIMNYNERNYELLYIH